MRAMAGYVSRLTRTPTQLNASVEVRPYPPPPTSQVPHTHVSYLCGLRVLEEREHGLDHLVLGAAADVEEVAEELEFVVRVLGELLLLLRALGVALGTETWCRTVNIARLVPIVKTSCLANTALLFPRPASL
jgi:hypothetical protein